ncbi:MAG: sigma-54-dependent Fis family transcriptional regulator [Candidatus Marinimicrobia bacterium]|nr:sigma-54-dependent Fis family transcriptional regulator [Candidatus Neomarinimicrobiota bacterium]
MKVMLVEDERISRITLTETLSSEGYDLISCATGLEALEYFENKSDIDILVTDLRLPRSSGIDILKKAKEKRSDITVIVMTAYATVETAVEALKYGAYDYITKPFSPDKLIAILKNITQFKQISEENLELKKQLKKSNLGNIIGISSEIEKLNQTISAVAPNDYNILIEGESGTGKEMVARALHQQSSRNKHDFHAVNCAAIPETLLESELFGHEKGAFTGADKQHRGYFERADGSTLFIDDIDDFPMDLQVKLLRILQEKELIRVGGSKLVKVDVRVIAATKISLKTLVDKNKFREDLYYRLNIIPIHIPPLRKRMEDIPVLLEHFYDKYNAKEKISVLNPDIMHHLMIYHWPGNVRELENSVQRSIALSNMNNWEILFLESLKIETAKPISRQQTNVQEEKESNEARSLSSYDDYIFQKEKVLFDWALKQSHNNISKAAELLKLPRSTFRSKMEKNTYYD